jgi:hypothetical protein
MVALRSQRWVTVELFGSGRSLVTKIQQHLGDPAHADAADADKVMRWILANIAGLRG